MIEETNIEYPKKSISLWKVWGIICIILFLAILGLLAYNYILNQGITIGQEQVISTQTQSGIMYYFNYLNTTKELRNINVTALIVEVNKLGVGR
jgi:hypothetical protein